MNDLLIYANNGGLGLILHGDEEESNFIENQSFVVNGEEIKPGNFSDLFGFFTEPMRFCGAFKDKPKLMVFYSGDSTDLFEKNAFTIVYIGFLRHASQINTHGLLRGILTLKMVYGNEKRIE